MSEMKRLICKREVINKKIAELRDRLEMERVTLGKEDKITQNLLKAVIEDDRKVVAKITALPSKKLDKEWQKHNKNPIKYCKKAK